MLYTRSPAEYAVYQVQTLGAFREPRQGTSRCIQVASQATRVTKTLTDSKICKSFIKLLIPSTVSKWASVNRALLKLTPKKYSLQQLDERAVKPSLAARLCSNARRSNSSMHGALCRCRVRGGLPRVRYTPCRLGERSGFALRHYGLGLRFSPVKPYGRGYTRFKP